MVGLPLSTLAIIIAMQLVVLIMGMFMETTSIMMVVCPIYKLILPPLGIDPLWFAVVLLLNLEMAVTTPPFGVALFVMKGVAPPDTTMGDIYKAGLPFLVCDVISIAVIMAFPAIALWLPGLMR